MPNQTVLFVSHPDKNCGVYQFGRNIARVLEHSKVFSYQYVECASRAELRKEFLGHNPAAVIYNHHPATVPWLTIPETRRMRVPQIGILHEVTQQVADAADGTLFDYHIAPDPTLLLRNPRVFKTGRFIPRYETRAPLPSLPTIGSFGFATVGKNFDRLVERVQSDFDEAHIRLHIPFARFGDRDGQRARAIARECRALVRKPNLRIDITHEFLEEHALLDFLAANSLNAFLYDDTPGRGISSTLDYALAVDRPIAISNSSMFRHLRGASPSIVVGENSLAEILANGTAPLRRFREDFSHENLLWEYDHIVSTVLARESSRTPSFVRENRFARTTTALAVALARRSSQVGLRVATAKGLLSSKTQAKLARIERGVLRRVGYFGAESPVSADWVPSSPAVGLDYKRGTLEPFEPQAELHASFNRALDDDARRLYSPAIDYLGRAAPEVISRKIARANVQQAFVLDTVTRFAGSPGTKRLLSIGSYEDTATIALLRGGYEVEEIDPLLNYDLATFVTKPSARMASYDIVFSTSVIEHVANDEDFVADIARLLRPGGVAVLTCDFREGFKPGDPMPVADRRLYTVKDLEERLLRRMPGCSFVDRPRWAGTKPDFEYGGTKYSFASFVVRKTASAA